ncbi:sodium:proton antiporter NhaD [methanotrophic endosymbiont of Bathymodiolus puteoserpentis (Logatchev)]|jgi:Na+/H+ antiporter NhaD/arsenite permease-like protein|uniref:sodium:proton antiporter NhaD n=1 Tax=methanotrophic endosymbiont of Bathymodiolus puteoserpentis (Logatchev) TaxID=343235 RepID=UPI0013C73F41|nr:sodium:proton antiporter NhaD [methanotrophic endosymbiont of Bathymodiolus puteoserpentis (Logatchev)]SHE21669.1 Na+/H+ antiporter NhaD type [methanotrophic endosymbiont of Bathymodiolus puteoserpentis (Logatchev)]
MNKKNIIFFFLNLLLLFPISAFSAEISHNALDLTSHISGYLVLSVFLVAYTLVIFEEKLHLQKSKPVLVAAGIIWAIIAYVYKMHGLNDLARQALEHNFLEYTELFFFLLVAMTYISAMIERGVFEALHFALVSRNYSYRQIFWITGIVAFFISPIADNLTTALIMCTVILTIGAAKPEFIAIACVNIVVAANAGGAFSPFGDITTLMVWQKGILEFTTFFKLFIPAVLNFVVPATIMYFYLPKDSPALPENVSEEIKHGGLFIVLLFLATIATSIFFHQFLHLPPAIGMLMGLGYLKLFGYYLRTKFRRERSAFDMVPGAEGSGSAFDVFSHIAKSEWDTLFFFYGIIMSVGGLGFMGYLSLTSEFMYGELGATTANILVGVASALIDNIPVMFAVLTMNPEMSETQWLLVTLTAGTGGSLLSIGSAAGVALMGQAKGFYTFSSHLKWMPAIALGYIVSIYAHLLIN